MDDPRLVALGLVPPAQQEQQAKETSGAPGPAPAAPAFPPSPYTPPANPFSAAARAIPEYGDPFTPSAPAAPPQPTQVQQPQQPSASSVPSIFNAPGSPFSFAPPAATASPAAPAYTPAPSAPAAPVSANTPFTMASSAAAPASFPAVAPVPVPSGKTAPSSKDARKEARRAAEAAKKSAEAAKRAAKLAEREAGKAAIAPALASVVAPVRGPTVRVEPVAPPKAQPWTLLMAAIAKHPAVIRKEVRSGLFRTMRLELAPIGIALVGLRGGSAYSWSEVKSVDARRGRIEFKTEANRERVSKSKEGGYTYTPYVEKMTRELLISIEGAGEPGLAPHLTRVMDDMRTSKFNYQATSWLEYENAVERLKGEFSEHDDQFVPAVAGALFAFTFLAGLFVLPEIVNLASDIRPPAGSGAFVIQPRYGWLDLRSFVMAVGLSALVTRLVLRLGLGSSAMSWARGTLRGWHTSGPMAARIATRELARLILGTSVTAAALLLGFAAYAPTVASTLVVDSGGIRDTVPLPLIGIERTWSDVSDVVKTPSPGRLEAFGVTVRFSDGRTITTLDHDLSGGTDGQLFQRATSWWQGATR